VSFAILQSHTSPSPFPSNIFIVGTVNIEQLFSQILIKDADRADFFKDNQHEEPETNDPDNGDEDGQFDDAVETSDPSELDSDNTNLGPLRQPMLVASSVQLQPIFQSLCGNVGSPSGAQKMPPLIPMGRAFPIHNVQGEESPPPGVSFQFKALCV